MAGQAQRPHPTGSFESNWVCIKCLEEDPRNKYLLSKFCLKENGHQQFCERLVWWRAEKGHLELCDSTGMPGKVPKIRPVPFTKHEGMKFAFCDPSRCWGPKCRFAHSVEEREVWNRTKFRPKDIPTVPVTGKPPMREDFQRLRVHPRSKRSETPSEQILTEELTPVNYQQRFLALIRCEQDAHVQELEKKCNGQYKLVIDSKVRSMMNVQESTHSSLCGYLNGLDGDQIAYCTQASEGIALQCHRHNCHAVILRVNYRRTDNKLYVCIDTRGAKLEKEVEVTATFELKVSYFDRLRSSVTLLSKNVDIVKRLQPAVEDFQAYSKISISSQCSSALNFDLCSTDQLEALTAAISSPIDGPPFLISGPFGSGKTRILALVSHFLFHNHQDGGFTRILVCTQQHVSADTFLECYNDLAEKKDLSLQVIRLVPGYFHGRSGDVKYTKVHELHHMKGDLQRRSKILIITTCSTAFSMFEHNLVPLGYFTHILIDEAAQVREPEVVGPLCFSSTNTKIILAGDQHQVGPALLVLGKQAQKYGLAVSLMERLHHLYTETIKGEALRYHRALTTSHRCAREILKLSEKLFYKTELKPSLLSHPDAPFPMHFVCSDIANKLKPLETATKYPNEAAVVVEQIRKWSAAWSKNVWGKKDFTEIAVASPTRSQLHIIERQLSQEYEDKYLDIQKSPTYDIQGKDYRVVILSTSEPTNADGSARDQTKSICNPFVFNTVISRARSLIVCVGNPYVLLRKEQHMVSQYGEKAKCWSSLLKLCFDNKTFSVGSPFQFTNEEVEWMCSPLLSIVEHLMGTQNPEEQADVKG